MTPILLILAGPSCVGKDPLLCALRRCHPDLAFASPVVHASRKPRPGERDGVDFHFRGDEEIAEYDRQRFFVYRQRSQMRAIDLDELARLLAEHERVVVQINPERIRAFREHQAVAAAAAGSRVVAVLLQPLTADEGLALARHSGRPVAEAVADAMRPKHIRRALQQGKLLDAAELDDIATRAAATWDEMSVRDGVDEVIVNHDAEGSEHWLLDPPIGDAGRALAAVAACLRG